MESIINEKIKFLLKRGKDYITISTFLTYNFLLSNEEIKILINKAKSELNL